MSNSESEDGFRYQTTRDLFSRFRCLVLDVRIILLSCYPPFIFTLQMLVLGVRTSVKNLILNNVLISGAEYFFHFLLSYSGSMFGAKSNNVAVAASNLQYGTFNTVLFFFFSLIISIY